MVEICHRMNRPAKFLNEFLMFVDLAPRLDNSSPPTVRNAGILIADTQLGKNYPKCRVFQSDTPQTILDWGSVRRRREWRGRMGSDQFRGREGAARRLIEKREVC